MIKVSEKVLIPTFEITGRLTDEQFRHRRAVMDRLAIVAHKEWLEEFLKEEAEAIREVCLNYSGSSIGRAIDS